MAGSTRSRRILVGLLFGLACVLWSLVLWQVLLPAVAIPVDGPDVRDMVRCSAGVLRRDAPPSQHSLDAFFIDRFEVTGGEYAAYLAEHPEIPAPPIPEWNGARKPPVGAEDLPITHLRHDEAALFCRSVGKRLPTSEEWEWAARGPSGQRFPWGDAESRSRVANTLSPGGFQGLTPVGLFESGKSAFGAYDLVGNVTEWTDSLVDGVGEPRWYLRGGSYLEPIRAAGSSILDILDTHRAGASSAQGAWSPIPSRVGGRHSRSSDWGFRGVKSATVVEAAYRIESLVRKLGERDPVGYFRKSRPARKALLEMGSSALPVVEKSISRLEPGLVRSRLESLASDIRENGGGA